MLFQSFRYFLNLLATVLAKEGLFSWWMCSNETGLICPLFMVPFCILWIFNNTGNHRQRASQASLSVGCRRVARSGSLGLVWGKGLWWRCPRTLGSKVPSSVPPPGPLLVCELVQCLEPWAEAVPLTCLKGESFVKTLDCLLGCHDKLPQTGRLKHKNVSSHCSGYQRSNSKVWTGCFLLREGREGLYCALLSLPGSQLLFGLPWLVDMSSLSLPQVCPHMTSSHESVSRFLLHVRTPSHPIRTYPIDFILLDHLWKGLLCFGYEVSPKSTC